MTIVERRAPGQRPQFLNAHVARFRAQLAARAGSVEEAERLFKSGAGLFRELGIPFYLAVTRLEHGEWLEAEGRSEEARQILGEAREIFEGLQAKPWLERVDRSPAVESGAAAAPPPLSSLSTPRP